MRTRVAALVALALASSSLIASLVRRPDTPIVAETPAAHSAGATRRELPAPVPTSEEVASEPEVAEEPAELPVDERLLADPSEATMKLARRFADAVERFDAQGVVEQRVPDFDFVYRAGGRAALRQAKAAGAVLVEARVRELSALVEGAPLPAKKLGQLIARPLAMVEASRREKNEQGRDDAWTRIRATPWLDGQRVIGVVFGINSVGGDDDTLVVLERDGATYKTAMVVAAHDHTSITSGLLALDHVVRPTSEGGYQVMTVNSSPWISSAWRGARLRVFVKGATASQPVTLFDEGNSARIGEVGADLQVLPGGFRADFSSWVTMRAEGGDGVVRDHVRVLACTERQCARVTPHVAKPEDLPDEWVRLPWAEAAKLTHPASRERLEAVHRGLKKQARDWLFEEQERDSERPGSLAIVFKETTGKARYRFELAIDGKEVRVVDVIDAMR